MRLNLNPNALIILALVAIISACSGKKSENTISADEFNDTGELKEQIKEYVFNIPSPSEIPYMLMATGAEYNQSLINDRRKVDKYTNRSDRAALNLGVYATDIGYLSSYDKTQDAIDYMGVCKVLADNLNISSSFDASLLRRFESNLANKDSLAKIINQSVMKAETFLRDDNRNKLAALMLTGSFIEGMYISTGVVKSYPKDILPDDTRNLILTPLMQIILNQEKSVDETIAMLETVEQTNPVEQILTDLRALQANFKKLNIQEQIKNNRADLVLSDATLAEITDSVERLRKGLVD
jgi:hypothetical protein